MERRWQLVPITDDIPEDPEMKALVDAARAPFLADDVDLGLAVPVTSQRLIEPLDTVVGRVEFDIDRRDALESGFNNAVTDAFREVSQTDVAISPGFRFDAVVAGPGFPLEDNTVARGDITLEDVYRFFPVSYSMATGETTVDALEEVLETLLSNVYSADAFAQGGGWVDGFSGVEAAVDLGAADGERVRDFFVRTGDTMLTGSDIVTVTGCVRPLERAGVLCSHAGFADVSPLRNESTGATWTPVDLFVHGLGMLEEQRDRRNIVDLSGQSRWPEDPFVQPLQASMIERDR